MRGTGQWDCAVITPIRGIPGDQSSTSHTYMTSGADKVASGGMIRKRRTRFYVIFKTIISIMVNRLFIIGYLLPDSFFLNPLKKLTLDLPRVLTVQMMFIPSMIVTEVWYDVNDANDVQ